jgi:hypothetical protein
MDAAGQAPCGFFNLAEGLFKGLLENGCSWPRLRLHNGCVSHNGFDQGNFKRSLGAIVEKRTR